MADNADFLIYLIRGSTGAGKTTYANRLAITLGVGQETTLIAQWIYLISCHPDEHRDPFLHKHGCR